MKTIDHRSAVRAFAVVALALLSCSLDTMILPRSPRPPAATDLPSAPPSPTGTDTQTPTAESTATASPSATPSLTETPTPIGVYQMDIPAYIVWYNTKIPLRTGQYMEIIAAGKSNISGQPNNDNWDPDGDMGNCPSDCLLPGAGYGTLIGKIIGGLPFKVGSHLTMVIPADGILLLAINDNEPYYFDNTGFYSVGIRIWNHYGNK